MLESDISEAIHQNSESTNVINPVSGVQTLGRGSYSEIVSNIGKSSFLPPHQ